MAETHTAAAGRFHAANPHVYRKLRDVALCMKASGRKAIGIGLLFERLRWISTIETDDDRYKLNNNYRAFYARLLMEMEPTLRDFFVTRESAFDPGFHTRRRPVKAKRPGKPPEPVGLF